MLTFYEAGYVPNPPDSGSPLQAAYRLGGFFDSQFRPDISNGASSHGDYGFYAVADQPLYIAPGSAKDSPQGLSGFARVSYAPDQRNPVVYYFDTGFHCAGMLPGRPKDISEALSASRDSARRWRWDPERRCSRTMSMSSRSLTWRL